MIGSIKANMTGSKSARPAFAHKWIISPVRKYVPTLAAINSGQYSFSVLLALSCLHDPLRSLAKTRFALIAHLHRASPTTQSELMAAGSCSHGLPATATWLDSGYDHDPSDSNLSHAFTALLLKLLNWQGACGIPVRGLDNRCMLSTFVSLVCSIVSSLALHVALTGAAVCTL